MGPQLSPMEPHMLYMWVTWQVLALVKLQRSFRAHLCRRLLKSLREVSRLKSLTR